MDFERASQLGGCLSKDYAPEMFRLLVNYRSLSASEAASRLDLHVQTAQSFLETLASLGILDKEESLEGLGVVEAAGAARGGGLS
jgi:DNA-binding IclR family transcriptional regulator